MTNSALDAHALCPVCDGLKTIIRPQLALHKFPELRGLEKLRGMPCPACETDEAQLAISKARQGQVDKSLAKAKVPPKFQNVRFADFKGGIDVVRMGLSQEEGEKRAEWKRRLYDYLVDLEQNIQMGMGLTIYGSVGTGKTLALAIIANALVKSGIDVVMLPERGLFDAVKATWNEGAKISEYEVIDQFRNVKVLMIDDFGVRAPTDWTVDIYHSIIDARWDQGLPTFISTNNTLEMLADDYARQVDRLSNNYKLEMIGDSLRPANNPT